MRAVRQAAKTVFSGVDLLLGDYPGPRILIYHEVGAGHGYEMDVDPEAFSRHLDWLQGHGTIVSLEAAIAGPPSDPASVFVLTFDDGYLSMYERAFPLLVERGLPFTLYLTTQPIETGRGLDPRRPSPPLTWAMVERMSASGLMTLGGHTHGHHDLRSLTAAEIGADLDQADQLIETRLGRRPRHFTYPWGYWSATADPLVRTRYASATVGGGIKNLSATDRYCLHRIPVQLSDGLVFFRRKMRRGQRSEEFVRRMVTGYRGP